MIDLEKLRKIYTFGKEANLMDAQIFIQSARTTVLKKRSILFEQGSKSSEILYLRKGLIRMYHIKENGDEITFNLIPEQNLVANFEFIGLGEPSTFYYETLEKCHFFSIDHAVLESIFNRNPRLEKHRKMFLREVVKKSSDRVRSFILMNAEERYLKFTKDFPDLINRVPDKYVAHILGITPVSLSRIRKRLASKS